MRTPRLTLCLALAVAATGARAAPLADRHYVVEHGRIVDLVEKRDLEASIGKLQRYLGV